MGDRRTNWAGNLVFGADRLHRPTSIDELQRVVAAASQIRALGTAHSFNPIADSAGDQVSVAELPAVMSIDGDRSTVTVAGGVRYGELAQHLHREGYALHNLGSLPHISVAGACATGTHGSGVTNGNLATAVAGVEFVAANGDLVRLDRDDAEFAGAVVALGLLGVVTSMTLDVIPTFDVAQYVYEDLPLAELLDHLDTTLAAAYSVSVFTDWQGPLVNQVWMKHRVGDDAPSHWDAARLAEGERHPVPGIDPINCTPQGGVPGPWHERLPHFRLDFTPSSGTELQTEYFVPRASAASALLAVDSIKAQVVPVLQISELRTIAADDLWLSPAYQRDSLAIHFTWIDDIAAVAPVVAALERQLAPYAARPHWGKVFSTSPGTFVDLYERLGDFAALAARFDPTGKFRNEFVERYIPRDIPRDTARREA